MTVEIAYKKEEGGDPHWCWVWIDGKPMKVKNVILRVPSWTKHQAPVNGQPRFVLQCQAEDYDITDNIMTLK